jgi:hypothetical protein
MNPHDREYAGAIAGMIETYGNPSQPLGAHWVEDRLVNVYAVGKVITFDATDGSRHMGLIREAAGDLYIVACDDGQRRMVHADSIYPF